MKKLIAILFLFLSLSLSADAKIYTQPYVEPSLHDAWYFLENIQDLPEEAQDAIRFHAEGDEDKAKERLTEAIRTASRNLGVRLVAAQWCLEIGNIRNARDQAQAALTLEPDSEDAQFVRGIVAMYEKDYVTAEINFAKILVYSPDNIAAIHYLALALCEQNDPVKLKRAAGYARLNVRMKDAPPEAFAAAGWVEFKRGNIAEAGEFMLEAIRASSGKVTNPDIKFYAAAILAKSDSQDQRNEAKEILDEILESKTPFYMRTDAERLRKEL